MKIGKLSITDLKEIIFKNIKNKRKEVISSPEIGGDCAVILTEGEDVIYLSSDPITGATTSIGKLAININANDIATSGVSPLGVMMTILAPVGTTKVQLEDIVKEAQEECDKLNMTILGGHTEITDGVNRVIVSITAIGIGKKSQIKEKKAVTEGDRIIITKGIGIEGVAIIASEKQNLLKEEFGEEFVEKCLEYINETSVVKDGIIGNKYAKGMHDATEGGVLGALWEMSELYNLGCEITYENIYIPEEIKQVTEFFKIDPLKLISSGTMIIVVSEDKKQELMDELKENNIKSFDIGFFTNKREKLLIKYSVKKEIKEPESDELYRVI